LSDPSDSFERAAEANADRVMSGGGGFEGSVQRLDDTGGPDALVQRAKESEEEEAVEG
jgi:hypothetical protein